MECYIIRADKIVARDRLGVMEDSGLLVKNEKVQKMYDNVSQVEIPEQINVIDYDDKVIISGMIDYHNHLALDARLKNHLVKMEDCEAEQTIHAIKTMKGDLAAGVTTSRCLGDRLYIDITCEKTQKKGRITEPKLVISGIGTHNSHGYGYIGMPHCGTEDFRRTSRENIARGADFLKAFMTKVINAVPFIYHFSTLEELRAVMKEAKSVNITTARRCSGEQRLDDCLTADIDCLKHVYYITQPQVERVKKEDHWMVYTPSYALNDQLLFKFSPHGRGGSLREKEIICKYLSDAIEGGLRFGIGTDGLHQDLAQEAYYISGLGAKNRDVPVRIIVDAARICGVDRSTGFIAEGKATDFAVLEGDPLNDIETLKKVTSIIQDGAIIF